MKMSFFVRASLAGMAGVLVVMTVQPAFAQMASVAAFDRTLETLRQSVAKLLKENAEINQENLAVRARIKAFRDDLRALQAETRRLEEKEAADRQRVQKQSGGVEALKLQVVEIDGVLKRARAEVSAEQAQSNALENEEKILRQKADTLSGEIALMNRSGAGAAAAREGVAALQAERQELEKALAAAAGRVEEARRQWQDLNAVLTAGPQKIAALKGEHDTLVKAVAQAESELVKSASRLAGLQADLEKVRSEDYSDTRSGRLSSEVKEMAERNRKLESEILAITQAREGELRRLQAEQDKAGGQYQARYEELLQRNVDLKFELESLRKQMVDLDKKKVGLEADVYPTR